MDRELISEAFLESNDPVRHHIDSYDDFLENKLQAIVDSQEVVETDIRVGEEPEEEEEEEEDEREEFYVRLGRIRVGDPVVKEADGSTSPLFPMEARIRGLTYAAPIYLEMAEVDADGEREIREVEVGQVPVMLKSRACNLYGLSDDELREAGEDPMDPGGYFIVNGSERILVTVEDLAPNQIMTERGDRYGTPIEVAKVFSQRQGYRALVVVERNRKGILEVSFPSISGRINLLDMMRALGIPSDEELMQAITDDSDLRSYVLENLEVAESLTEGEAFGKVGKKIAAGQAAEFQSKRAQYVIDRHLLPHLGNDEEDRVQKARYLGRMAEACLAMAAGKRQEDDKDHYANKRVNLSGDLMEQLFRVAFFRICRDVKYQLERANTRNRDLNVKTAVRPDVLSQRLRSAMATGNWPGGRSGVAQLLDRTDHMATLTHTRRVVSPLSRSQPHFEARDLHATHWGRICPSETPEGPNCGLVKNFAMMADVTRGRDPVDMDLFELGVNPKGRGA
ncbi:MAG: DNA-directed RNA polymerase subunit B'' [Methanonatronarchaeales archaeon]|nr:DNA-directed RNA polymerase subunit B'' [Methanonatronarchaeales archaeon]